MEKQDREKISDILTKIAVIHAPGIPLGFIKRKVSKIVNILEKNIDDHGGIITSESIKNLKEELSKMRNKDKGEFSEATIERIRTGENVRQRKILHVFEVGFTPGSVKKVEAPTAEAAALFYGLNTGEQLSAEVYTMDGEEYEGNRRPLFRFLFYQKWVGELKEKLEEVKPLLELCRFLEGEIDKRP